MTKEQHIHKGLIEYLMNYTAFEKWYFGFSRVQPGAISIIPIPGERYIEQWIEGGGYCEYQFAVGIFQKSPQAIYVPDKQTEQLDDAFDVQAFMGWIENQNDVGNFPRLGNNLIPCRLKVLQGVPTITGENETTQKMLFSAAVYYYEIKE